MIKSFMEIIAGNEVVIATVLFIAALVLIVVAGRIVSSFIKPALKLSLMVIAVSLIYSYKPEICRDFWSRASDAFCGVTKTVQESLDDYIAGHFK